MSGSGLRPLQSTGHLHSHSRTRSVGLRGSRTSLKQTTRWAKCIPAGMQLASGSESRFRVSTPEWQNTRIRRWLKLTAIEIVAMSPTWRAASAEGRRAYSISGDSTASLVEGVLARAQAARRGAPRPSARFSAGACQRGAGGVSRRASCVGAISGERSGKRLKRFIVFFSYLLLHFWCWVVHESYFFYNITNGLKKL